MKRDRSAYERDEECLKYNVTENVKVSLLAAANEYEDANAGASTQRQMTPLNYELGLTTMPTLDEGEEDKEEGEQQIPKGRGSGTSPRRPSTEADPIALALTEGPGVKAHFLINLQPAAGSDFCKLLYERRRLSAQLFGVDATHLYPLHISATGFLEIEVSLIPRLVQIMKDILVEEFTETSRVTVGRVICTPTGYVLFDIVAPAISGFSRKLADRSQKELEVTIRPKAVNHISLACSRNSEAVRDDIKRIYEPEAGNSGAEMLQAVSSGAPFDLVLSRLLRRSSFEAWAREGPHKFAEVARLPVRTFRPRLGAAPGGDTVSESGLASGDAASKGAAAGGDAVSESGAASEDAAPKGAVAGGDAASESGAASEDAAS
jgi:hypothetical protein